MSDPLGGAGVLEALGFYSGQRPIDGLIESTAVAQPQFIDRRVKYALVFDPSKLGADAVFELYGSPCIYFRYFASEPSAAQVATMQRLAWNHGLAPLLWIVTPTAVRLFNCYAKPTSQFSIDDAHHLIEVFNRTRDGLVALKKFAGLDELRSGRFWEQAQTQRIDRRDRVDAPLCLR